MTKPAFPYCPNCKHEFSLVDLKTMAIGDGYRRMLGVYLASGERAVVDFNEFNPLIMTPIEQ
jgi:hypothetical protein